MTDIKIINTSGHELKKATDGSAGYDLIANIDAPITIKPQEAAKLIPTGIKLDMTAHPHLAAFIMPRSGLGHKKGLVLGNGTGVIDADYQGEVFISAWNRNPELKGHGMNTVPNDAAITINPGDAIAQMVFIRTEEITLTAVESFEETSKRGEGGFGSTGTKRRAAKQGDK